LKNEGNTIRKNVFLIDYQKAFDSWEFAVNNGDPSAQQDINNKNRINEQIKTKSKKKKASKFVHEDKKY
jgi:hypothetical protein